MSDIKLLRKQIRNVVQADLADILKKEVFVTMQDQIAKLVIDRLTRIELDVKKTLKELDDRSLSMQSFVMRQVASQQPEATLEEVTKELLE